MGSAPLAIVSAVAVMVGAVALSNGPLVQRLWREHQIRWEERAIDLHRPPLRWTPWFQAGVVLMAPLVLWLAGGVALPPWFLLMLLPGGVAFRGRQRNREQLEVQLEPMLVGLANALRTTGNLVHAIDEVAQGEPEPMGRELRRTLVEVRLGKPVEEALNRLADRSGVPSLQAVVTQLAVGKRTGGDLPGILEVTASSLREMRRLEGVVQTRTAEGRSQALVMGLVPPFLGAGLHFMNPGWLAPMWSEPLGWVLLGVCALLEVGAVLLIRRIVAVDI